MEGENMTGDCPIKVVENIEEGRVKKENKNKFGRKGDRKKTGVKSGMGQRSGVRR